MTASRGGKAAEGLIGVFSGKGAKPDQASESGVTKLHARIGQWAGYHNARRPHSTVDGAVPDKVYTGLWQKNMAAWF